MAQKTHSSVVKLRHCEQELAIEFANKFIFGKMFAPPRDVRKGKRVKRKESKTYPDSANSLSGGVTRHGPGPIAPIDGMDRFYFDGATAKYELLPEAEGKKT